MAGVVKQARNSGPRHLVARIGRALARGRPRRLAPSSFAAPRQRSTTDVMNSRCDANWFVE